MHVLHGSGACLVSEALPGAQITCLLVRDLDPVVRKRLAEVVQLVQSYRRLAEFEISAGERPRAGEVALPEDTEQRVRQWVEGEEKRSHEKDKLSEELGEVMRVHAHDPTPIQEAMGG